jgi:small subunit ribosomal protein S16
LKMGATPSDRVHRFLTAAEMLPAAERREQPQKSAPKAKAQERAKAAADAAAAAAEKPAEGGEAQA